MDKKRKTNVKTEKYRLGYDELRLIIAIVVSAAMTAVFFGMALPVEGFYGSDSPSHIKSGIELEGYSLTTIFIYLASRVATFPFLQLIVALYESILVMVTWYISQRFMDEFFDLDRSLILAISTGLIFLTAIYIPGIMPDFYKEGFGTQPWHNTTYLGMRCMGVIYLLQLFRVLPRYQKGIKKSEWGGIALTLAITTAFKPNFLLSVCAVLGLLFIVDLIRFRTLDAFKNIVIMGTTVFPSLAVLVLQYVLIYVTGNSEGASGIEVVWFSDLMWYGTPGHMFVKLFRSVAFALVVLVLAYRRKDKKTDINMVFSIMLYVVSLVVFSMFKETGSRAGHGNFGWAIPMGFYAMYLYIVPWFFQRYKEYRAIGACGKTGANSGLYCIGLILLAAHLLSGICYYIIVASGASYYL